MRQSNGSDNGGNGQRTVAELLAMYGESAPSTSGRRRRRRPDEDGPGDSAVTTRVTHDTDDELDRPSPSPRRRARPHAVDPPTPPELRYDPLGVDALLGASQPLPIVGGEDDRPTRFDLPVIDDDVTLTQPHMFPSDLSSPLNETDQLPTVGAATDRSDVLDSTAAMPTPVADDEDDEAVAYGREALDFTALAPLPRTGRRRSVPAFAPSYDEEPEPTSETELDLDLDLEDEDDWDEDLDGPRPVESPLKEWAVVAAQVGVGVVGGAALWLICEWLWQSLPVVALVVALGVITGLVWVVRKVRRAEDLQTTLVAVLVGLFVTVSPAALLLVDK